MPALCNRLDRNTGGLVIAAKNFQALRDMNCMIREKWVDKYYKSIVKGTINEESRIEGFLAKDESTNTVKIFDEQVEGSKEICTLYKPLKLNSQGFTLLEIKLITGKPHQIRAHLAYSGYPIVGDYKYGDRMVNRNFRESYGLKSQFLYAHRLIFSETTEFFEYLKGMEIRTELPHELEIIEEDLFR
jgi:23S rRNA pseudouridine955/2504/2580 synthase